MIYLLPGQQWLFNERVLSYLQLLDTQETYYFWQKQLKQINVIFKTLLPVTQTALVDLDANVTLCTSERLHLLQQHFLNHPSRLTYEKTLQSLDPIVALSYQFWQGRIRNAQDFMQLDPQAYVPNPKNGKIYSSTSFLQIKTQTINPINLQASLRLPLSYFNKKPFQQLRQNEENNKNQQRFYLELLKATAKRTTTDNNNTDTLEELDLAGCEVIDDGELIELLRFLPNLRRLNIENCRQLGAQTVFKILTNHLSANSFYNKTTDVLCYQLTKIKLTTGFHRKENHTITLTGQHKDRELLASKINPYWQIIHQVLDETNQLSHNNPQNLIIYSRILEKWSITNHDLEKHIVLLKNAFRTKNIRYEKKQ
ncbi:MAG: hypothetical protein HWD59_08140 [Coxiellaceae bacterium]|nr:MAG: hypothetical protein HWD59_08140 [Coxiellaceae bacterium]